MRKSKGKGLLAEIISRVFDPVWEIPLALILAVVVAVNEGWRWRFVGLLLFIDAIVPMIFFVVMLVNKQIKDWDIQNRRERIPLYLFTLFCHLGGLWIARETGKTELVAILLVYYAVAVVFFLITIRYKISLHTGVNAVLITTLNVFAGWQSWWLYGVLIMVMWARVYQKHHSLVQAILGAILGGGMVILGLWLVKLGYFRFGDF